MKINECPYCGKPNSHIEKVRDAYRNIEESEYLYWNECDYCLSQGPVSESEDKALESWNNRNTRAVNNFEPLLEALKEAHKAIDILFSQRIAMDANFFPSKSGQPWDAIKLANQVIKSAEASNV